ncbi:hypothetical protein BH23ACT2_BH23ACT2_02050 [soil metagenome]
MYDLIAKPLEFFYGLWPNYAAAIALLTLAIMVLLLPLTLKGTRSMLAMQKLQPRLKEIQQTYRDDRQKLNVETMKLYKANNINPMSGCLPVLAQLPVFILLYQTLIQLTTRAPFGQDMGAAAARSAGGAGAYDRFGAFYPNFIDRSSQLYRDLNTNNEMRALGMDLADSAQSALGAGFVQLLPYLALVGVVAFTAWFQQRQISGRSTGQEMSSGQARLLKALPVFFVFISFVLPAGIVVYFAVSNTFRIGQQAFITRTMYGDDGPGGGGPALEKP